MARLILTDKEKAADLWSDLSDDALGKVCRHLMVRQRADGFGRKHEDPAQVEFWQLATVNAAKVLIIEASETNADRYKLSFKGMRAGDEAFGDWTITIERGYHPDEEDGEDE